MSRALRQLVAGLVLFAAAAEWKKSDASAQAPRALALDEVLASARRHHPRIENARADVRAAEGERLSASGGFDLELAASGYVAPVGYYQWGRGEIGLRQATPLWGTTFSAGWRVGRGDVPDYYGERETLEGGELRVRATVPLWRDGAIDGRRARIARAEGAAEASQKYLEVQLLATHLAATEAYYRWAGAGLKREIAAHLVTLAEERDAQIAARVAAGQIAAIESLENRRVIAARRTVLVSARRELERAAIALSLYLRDSRGRPLVASDGRLPSTLPGTRRARESLEDAVRRAWAQRPESERFRALTARQDVAVSLAENQRGPRIDLGVGASFDLGGGTTAQQETLAPPVVEASLTFALPLQNRGARGALAEAHAEREALDAEARWMRERLEAQVRDAYSAISASEEAVGLARESAEVAQAVAEAEYRRFELGATQLWIVTQREAAAAQAGAILVDAEVARAVAHVRRDVATGEAR